MSSTENYVTQASLLDTTYAMIALTSTFMVARISIQVLHPKKLAAEDYLIYLAYILYIIMAVLYILVTPTIYKTSAVTAGRIPPYATIMADYLFIIKIFFVNTEVFWLVLWSVKFSLLAFYRRLLAGLHTVYIKLWWGVLVFCIVTLIGCIVSNFTSCSSMHAWFTPGACATPRDVQAQIASLYYSYAVDVLSDLMIMGLPIQLIWKLQMPWSQKISVIALFCTGFVCITFATLRVVEVGMKSGSSSTPSSSWLALWAVIECSIAIIIGCCPAFAALYRQARNTQKASYDPRGYSKQPSDSHRSGTPV
ncbi:hypothetical protein BDV95DRAFT_446823, partial [Massariosphaeria phaeospora]